MSAKVAKLFSKVFPYSRDEDDIIPTLEDEVARPEETVTTTKQEDQPHMSSKKKHHGSNIGKFHLKNVKPYTFTQEEVFKAFMSGGNLMLHGIAGTGKTFIAMYLALKEVERYQLEYDKVIVIRSGVPSRDLGYLPGSVDEKAAVYECPYEEIACKLYERGDAYDVLKAHGKIEFMTTSFLRGITLERCIVIVDEIQNMTYGELSTIITRMGDRCRVIFCGDFRQTDLFRTKERDGLKHFLNIIDRMPEFSFHEFNATDIVRSKLVKSFIIEEAEYRDTHPEFDY